ncbi:Sodium/hydrogen exchanger family-domain-containing protein [Paraphysoderma sedebokerense]|nr:Sodium/hydrogen exchanger family-domain-containing protein [Paraphysoderma sedebokerense]
MLNRNNILSLLAQVIFLLVLLQRVQAAEEAGPKKEEKNENQNSNNEPMQKMEQKPVIEVALPFVFFSLAFGSVLQHFLKQLPKFLQIPYTVALFLVGISIAAIESALRKSHTLGHLGESIDITTKIDPRVILFLLLPPLVFESAFSINWHVFKRIVSSAGILALPSVFISVALTAAYFMGVSSYNWTWAKALLLGSILSTTDPVAVVAALQSVGAPARVSTLIEGAALLNDGSAFVLFIILSDIITGAVKSPLGLIGFTIKLTLGGPLIGLLMAFGTIKFVRLVFNNALIETTAIMISVYATFFIAEDELHTSGVLAVLAFGLYMAYRGKFELSHEIEEHFHTNLTQFAYWANTFLFLAAGILTYDKLSITNVSTNPVNWLVLLGFYLASYVIRFISIGIFFPILSRVGYGMRWKDVSFLVWTGIRGGISITLSLLLDLQTGEQDPTFHGLVAFHVAGMVFLTMLINGSTTERVYNGLRIDKPNPFLPHQIQSALDSLEHDYRKKEKQIRKGWLYRYADFDAVMTIVPDFRFAKIAGTRLYFQQSVTQTVQEETEVALSSIRRPSADQTDWRMSVLQPQSKILVEKPNKRKSYFPRSVSVPEDMTEDMKNHINTIFLNAVRANYHHQFAHGYLSGESTALLCECADMAGDCGKSSMRQDPKYSANLPESKKIEQEFEFIISVLPSIDDKWKPYMHYPIIGELARKKISNAIATTAEILFGFIHAHHHSLKQMDKVAGEIPYLASLKYQVNTVSERAKTKLRDIDDTYPIILRELLTVMASKNLIQSKRELVEQYYEEGFLNCKIQQQLVENLEDRLSHLHNFRPTVSTLPNQEASDVLKLNRDISRPVNLAHDEAPPSPRANRYVSVLFSSRPPRPQEP